jgi:hypothetical protein
LGGSRGSLRLGVDGGNGTTIKGKSLVLDSALLGSTEGGLLELDTDDGLDGELDIGILSNTGERGRDDIKREEGEVDTLSGLEVVGGQGGTGSKSEDQVTRVGIVGGIDGNLADEGTADGGLIRGNIGAEVSTLRNGTILEQEGGLGSGVGVVGENTEGTTGTNVNLDLSAEILRLELNIDSGSARRIVGSAKRAVGTVTAINTEGVAVTTVQSTDVGQGQHDVTIELVANRVGVTSRGGQGAINVEGTLRSGLRIIDGKRVTLTSSEVLELHGGQLEGPLERSSQDDATVGRVDVGLTGEQDLLGNDSGLKVDERENGDVGGNDNALGESDLDGDQVLQVALNDGATETGKLLSVLNSDDGTVSGEARLNSVVLIPTALKSGTPRDSSGVRLDARESVVGGSETVTSGLDLLVPEETRVAAAVVSGISDGGGIADEHLSASTTGDQRRLDVEDQAVVLITVGWDTVGDTSNQRRVVGGEALRNAEGGIAALLNISAVDGAVGAIHSGVAVAETSGTADTEAGILVGETKSAGAEARGSGNVSRLGADSVGNNANTGAITGERSTTRTDLNNLVGSDTTS